MKYKEADERTNESEAAVMNRIYIFTGKGGVGKSSVATAHALKSANEGHKTLLVSTDMAHNIGDIFGISLGKEPYEVLPNLDAYEIDPDFVLSNYYQDMLNSIVNLLPDFGGNQMEDYGMIPGTEELFSLLEIARLYEEGSYERIIVDCAPTGETLSLLKFPELLSWYMEKLFPIGKVALRLLAPVAKKCFRVQLPNKTAMNDMERMYLKLMELQELLKNWDITSIRLVTIPEKMVVEETKRNYVYKIPWYNEELKGRSAINRICQDALNDENIFESKVIKEREQFEENEKGYQLAVFLPNAGKDQLELFQSNTDVVIRLGNFKRNITLPDVLRSYHIESAKHEEEKGYLKIQFVE